MIHFKGKGRRFLATASAVLCLALSLCLFAPAARAGICERAVAACLLDAGLTLVHNFAAGLAYAVFCWDGYNFCLVYYAQ